MWRVDATAIELYEKGVSDIERAADDMHVPIRRRNDNIEIAIIVVCKTLHAPWGWFIVYFPFDGRKRRR